MEGEVSNDRIESARIFLDCPRPICLGLAQLPGFYEPFFLTALCTADSREHTFPALS